MNMLARQWAVASHARSREPSQSSVQTWTRCLSKVTAQTLRTMKSVRVSLYSNANDQKEIMRKCHSANRTCSKIGQVRPSWQSSCFVFHSYDMTIKRMTSVKSEKVYEMGGRRRECWDPVVTFGLLGHTASLGIKHVAWKEVVSLGLMFSSMLPGSLVVRTQVAWDVIRLGAARKVSSGLTEPGKINLSGLELPGENVSSQGGSVRPYSRFGLV